MYRTSFSFVAEAKPNGRAVTWFGYDAAHGTAYLPFFGAAHTGAPEAWHSHEGSQSKFSYKVAWWAFNIINQYSDINFGLINHDVKSKAQAIEAEAVELVAKWEMEASELDEATALKHLTQKSNSFAEAKLAEWWELATHLWVKFGRYVVTFNETEIGENAQGQAYPTWWLQSPDVGFLLWAWNGPYHGISDTGTSPKAVALAAEATAGHWSSVIILALFSNTLVACLAYSVGMQRGRMRAPAADCYVPCNV